VPWPPTWQLLLDFPATNRDIAIADNPFESIGKRAFCRLEPNHDRVPRLYGPGRPAIVSNDREHMAPFLHNSGFGLETNSARPFKPRDLAIHIQIAQFAHVDANTVDRISVDYFNEKGALFADQGSLGEFANVELKVGMSAIRRGGFATPFRDLKQTKCKCHSRP